MDYDGSMFQSGEDKFLDAQKFFPEDSEINALYNYPDDFLFQGEITNIISLISSLKDTYLEIKKTISDVKNKLCNADADFGINYLASNIGQYSHLEALNPNQLNDVELSLAEIDITIINFCENKVNEGEELDSELKKAYDEAIKRRDERKIKNVLNENSFIGISSITDNLNVNVNEIVDSEFINSTKNLINEHKYSNKVTMEKLGDVSNWFIQNVPNYDMGGYVSSCPYVTGTVRKDCTGFVGAYMAYVAGVDKFTETHSAAMVDKNGTWAKEVEKSGWKAYSTDEITELMPGDVLVANPAVSHSSGHHAEVYVDENHTFGWGSVQKNYPANRPVTKSIKNGHVIYSDLVGTKNQHDYVTVYRYENYKVQAKDILNVI